MWPSSCNPCPLDYFSLMVAWTLKTFYGMAEVANRDIFSWITYTVDKFRINLFYLSYLTTGREFDYYLLADHKVKDGTRTTHQDKNMHTCHIVFMGAKPLSVEIFLSARVSTYIHGQVYIINAYKLKGLFNNSILNLRLYTSSHDFLRINRRSHSSTPELAIEKNAVSKTVAPLIEDTHKKFKYLWLSTKSFSENFLFSNSWKREIFVIRSQNQ